MLYNVNMFTNGRSIHLIQTTDERRQTIWLHVFGTDALPVLAAKPRWQAMQGRGFDVLAFDLALGELSDAQRQRFAGYLSRKYRMDYAAALVELQTAISWPIEASIDVMVVEPAEQRPLASLLEAIMGRRFFNERGGEHVSFSEKWPGVGVGRYWKRQLSKARRRYVKAKLTGHRGKEPTHYEGFVNYKTW